MTRIVVDSTCDLPAETMAALDIVSVPLKVHFGDEVFRDKIDMDEEQFFSRLENVTKLPTTSQPSPGEFVEAYRALPEGESVISIHIAHQLSGTASSAQLAASDLPERDIRVVDSGSVTWGAGLLVMAA
ncbi:MAG TPA: DegV family protein, partial [Candidatus Dormibacteraeota bacterium]|nr:DegV family protein [Candidatus Dormibacteraeota bacterium]